jgi:predicted nucleotidyltransferase
MPIPDLDADGLLPEGIHEATIDDVRAGFGRFQRTDQRPHLFERLEKFILEARSTGLIAALIVNGSFVTGKDEPSDIDLVVVLRPDHDFQVELPPFQYNTLSKRRVRKRYRFDVLLAREDSIEYEEYVRFFQQVKERPHRQKGILKVLL